MIRAHRGRAHSRGLFRLRDSAEAWKGLACR